MVVVQSLNCIRLQDPMDSSPPGSSIRGIFQNTGVVAISFSRGSSPPWDWTPVSCTTGTFFTDSATKEAHTFKKIL